MSFQDPISDCLNRIRNGLMRGKDSVIVPYSKIKHDLVNVLIDEGYLNSCEKIDNGGKDEISVNLKYFNGKPAIKDLKRISRRGLRKYSGSKDLSNVKAGLGIYVISTNQGLMTDRVAKSKNVGGEILAEVF